MKLLFAFIIAFASQASALEINVDQVAFGAQWEALVQRAHKDGNKVETVVGTLSSLARKTVIEPDTKWTESFFTIAGQMTLQAGFVVTQSSLSFEEWERSANGNSWIIKQKFYYMNSMGEFQSAVYRTVEKFDDSTVTITDGDAGTLEAQRKEWSELLVTWF